MSGEDGENSFRACRRIALRRDHELIRRSQCAIIDGRCSNDGLNWRSGERIIYACRRLENYRTLDRASCIYALSPAESTEKITNLDSTFAAETPSRSLQIKKLAFSAEILRRAFCRRLPFFFFDVGGI